MEIEFRTGNIYRYYEVPPRMWKIFQMYVECEGSAGAFFNEYIKNNLHWRNCVQAVKNDDLIFRSI